MDMRHGPSGGLPRQGGPDWLWMIQVWGDTGHLGTLVREVLEGGLVVTGASGHLVVDAGAIFPFRKVVVPPCDLHM